MLQDRNWKVKHDAKQILHDAAQYLETHGWCQGAMYFEKRVCLFGAVRTVIRERGEVNDAVETEVMNRLQRICGNGQNPASWNDAPDRTKQQVIDALKKAAR